MNAFYLPAYLPKGFAWAGVNVGIKDTSLDFALAKASKPCSVAGVFTQNNFPGAPVVVSRQRLKQGTLQALVINSKNANVATGQQGVRDAERVCAWVAGQMGIASRQVAPSSTGVIGRPLPMEKIEAGCAKGVAALGTSHGHFEAFAKAIMTTDTRCKAAGSLLGEASLVGAAKGAGMIAPDMATMLAYFFSDARVESGTLQKMLGRVTTQTFNRVSIDTDTSTSDSVIAMANGLGGEVAPDVLEEALYDAALHLSKEIARDGEGATKLIALTVQGASSQNAANAIARAIVDSPLVKTAIHGADPNWGRFVMAIGKVQAHRVPLENLRIGFGRPPNQLEISAQGQSPKVLRAISQYLQNGEVEICVTLGTGDHSTNVWGCDLTAEYVRINAEYTT